MDLICLVLYIGTSDVFRQTTKMMNLFPVTEKPSKLEAPQDFKSMNLFPMQAVFGSYVPREGISKIAEYRYIWFDVHFELSYTMQVKLDVNILLI